jgi:S-adenosyl-L-methionine hydrolase (adenosine-forming)
MAIITLTTDFGDGSSYVAAMKGAVLSVNPAARLLDLSHRLPPQSLVATAWFLADSLPWFPPGTIHVVVVDPGVGTGRALLCVEWSNQVILAPDNGCWTPILQSDDSPPRVYRLENPRLWRPTVSPTFHGRDVLAPVAGHLSLGATPADLGPRVSHWASLTLPDPEITTDGVRGEVVVVDTFGNLVTNIGAGMIRPDFRVLVDLKEVSRFVQTYGDAEPGTLVVLIGSTGRLEIAVVNGSAAARLGVSVGTVVEVRLGE